jgi:L-threonylcarbamoyladenylate synthase
MNFDNDINACLEVLKNGGLILYPTDTIWGIGCDATNETAVAKIFELKKRPDEKSLIILLADERSINKYVTQPDPAVFDYLEQTIKPTTVIYEGAIGLADNLIHEDGTVAIRIVQDDFCKHLIKRLQKPLVSTSANISGEASPKIFSEISAQIKSGVDYIVQHRRDDITIAAPSSIIKWNIDGSLTVIRP